MQPIEDIKKIVILDTDDLSSTKTGFGLLLKMKEHYPQFKCTCFSSALDISLFYKKIKVENYRNWIKLIKQHPWVEIAPHGFCHVKGDSMIKDENKTKAYVRAIENTFKLFDFPYVKVFKAPHWECSDAVEEALKEKNYVLAIDRNNPKVFTDIKTYIFNWSIDEKMPNYPVLKAHGHIHGTNNGLDVCYPNLLKLPTNTIFKTIGEYLKENETTQDIIPT